MRATWGQVITKGRSLWRYHKRLNEPPFRMPLSIHVELLELGGRPGSGAAVPHVHVTRALFPLRGPLGFHFQKCVRLLTPTTGQVSDLLVFGPQQDTYGHVHVARLQCQPTYSGIYSPLSGGSVA